MRHLNEKFSILKLFMVKDPVSSKKGSSVSFNFLKTNLVTKGLKKTHKTLAGFLFISDRLSKNFTNSSNQSLVLTYRGFNFV